MVDIPANSTTGTNISVGGMIVDQLEVSGDHDWIRIELTAGHLYVIDLSGSGSNALGDPYLYIRNSAGELIDSDDDSGSGLNSRLHFMPETTGTYYIDVGAFFDGYRGTYQLNVAEIDISNDIPGNRSTTAAIAVDETLVSQIDYPGDRDFIRVELSADHVYAIDLSGSGANPLSYPYLQLRNSDGTVVESDSHYDPVNSQLEFRPATTGTYYIDVEARFSDSGTYRLSLGEIDISNDIPGNRSTTATIAVDETLVSQLEYRGDRDFIRVELTADHVYVMDLSGSGADPLSYPYLQLRNSDGTVVDSDSSFDGTSAHLEFRPATTGTYYIDVESRLSDSDGTYRLSLGEIDISEDVAGDAGTTASIDVGGSVVGQLEYMDDRDWFRIDLAEGQRIVVTTSGTGDWPILRDSNGEYLSSQSYHNYGSARFAYVPTASGTYYIDVGTFYDDARGFYDLTVVQSDPITSSGNVDSVWGFNSTSDTAGYDPAARVDDLVYIGDQGGIDTLDFSGFTQSQTIDLAPGATSSVGGGGSNLEIAPDTVIENAVGGSGSDSLYGNDADNLLRGNANYDVLYGFSGDDILDGGAGSDYMTGGSGNDTYYVDSPYDGVSDESGNDDVVYASVDYVMAYAVEQLFLTGAAERGTGNALANRITGNALDNFLDGRGGDDVLDGGSGADTLIGGVGNDMLDGGTGDDHMRGGRGDDVYRVDSNLDLISERAAEGSDTVVSTIDYRLGNNLEALELAGSAVRGTGNSQANEISGNAQDNVIDGGLRGDVMRGGAGDDFYFVDHARDRVIENAGEGSDTVYTSLSYVLADNVETLLLRGEAVRATGNGLDNVLRGTADDNVLDGRGGADAMRGGAGNDTYYVENPGDHVVEAGSAGEDRVYATATYRAEANVENVFLRGSAAYNAYGNRLDNVLSGNDADNLLDGGRGADDLRGGGGADTFLFRGGGFGGLTPSTSDRIVDFSQADNDRIDLHLVDADTGTAGRQNFAFIGTAAFSNTAGELRYDITNGNTYLTGDTDGDGTADFMIRLDGSHALVGGDFVL